MQTSTHTGADGVAGERVVVTGGARGIGAALARRFAAGGAHVAVNDLDAARAAALAREIGGVAVPGDASTAATAAREALGRVDVFCANAGVAPEGGPEASEESWETAWDVNVMAHVGAARELLPGWLDRGHGRFVATVSAAGLLSMVGSAPYSVSKHAALAFAEWLALTYRHRGVRVHALCPQGVRTDMLQDAGPVGAMLLAPHAIEPEEVADALFDAMPEDDFLVLPHPRTAEQYAMRAAAPDRWLAGMSHLQQKLERTLSDRRQEARREAGTHT